MNIENFTELIDSGLVREQFIRTADGTTLDSLKRFLSRYVSSTSGATTTGSLMIQHGILTPELVENTIIADDRHTWAFKLGFAASPELEKLIKSRALGTAVAMQILNHDGVTFRSTAFVKKLASVLTPGESNAVNFGITGIFEYEAVLNSLFNQGRFFQGSRRDEFFDEKHRLVRAFRTREHLEKKRRQIKAVISVKDNRPLLTQFDAIWRHYAAQSELFTKTGLEQPIAEHVRAQNVACVNNWQNRASQQEIESPHQRFIDIYGRYNCAEMDPLMLALIARTAGWYVDNRHAWLFTKVRLVPDRFRKFGRGGGQTADHIPWAALAAYPGMSLLEVEGEDFKTSLLGANRLFLTHSLATDATNRKSIPIIGLATWKNTGKYTKDEPYALFAADFDKDDCNRFKRKNWDGTDHASSIAGVISETLRALREVEALEIACAAGIELHLGPNHRWAPAEDKAPESFLQNDRYKLMGGSKTSAIAGVQPRP